VDTGLNDTRNVVVTSLGNAFPNPSSARPLSKHMIPTGYNYTVSEKNDTDVTHYRFNPHQPISVIFGRDVAERVYAIEW